ncbi:hypothetical protein BDV95DRAFT_342294 [Massariosphaeria phaeospora]|uniref:DUF2293 domain-containing protein n=1 Tax=Massariosphaeria phaeospora TaxID=100035 RepID=A0A7C8IG69_9PLEO|nr:hypothetical protein BDV95DRAFT_342294 [Massariosphaeria phaeospora]
MTRTNGVASHRGSRLRYATPVHHSILQNKKISYTVKLERVKQLRKRTTYKLTPPPEYTFMPCGFPDITKYCKKVCTEQRLTVAFVSSPEAFTDPNSVSNNNNRIGYHFPKKVLNQALSVLGYVWMDGTVVKVADANDAFSRRVEELLTGGRPHHTTTEIAGVMRDLFPKMPEKDLMKIISHSFVEGSGRVGATTDIPLARKVQLAVGAHIRHTYTDYDRMLSWKRGFNVNRREEVRRQIEPAIVAKIREWRGDEGVEGDKIEDGFREVIEIPDSDDDDEVEVIEISDDDDEEDQDNVASSANESNRSAAYSSGPHLANAHQPNNRSGNALVAPRRLEQVPGVTFHEQHPRLDFAAAEPRILRQVPRATINQQNFRLDNALAESKTPRELPRAVFRQPVYYVKDDAVQSDSGGAYTAPSTRTTHRHGAASEPKPSSMRGHETFGRAYGRPELSSYVIHCPRTGQNPLTFLGTTTLLKGLHVRCRGETRRVN